MSVKNQLSKILPQSLKRVVKRWSITGQLRATIAAKLPPVICVDVGASYYPHVRWALFLESPRTRWVAVEPNAANTPYVADWSWPAKIDVLHRGLSEAGGPQTLYITNVDSGSSLYPPEIKPAMRHRVADESYFFPVTPHRIDTTTLLQAIALGGGEAPVVVKLDTQGSELSILRGAASLLGSEIVGIEMESTLLAQPIMKGSGKFWEACSYLEEKGYELLDLKLIPGLSKLRGPRPDAKRVLNECDAVFGLRRDIIDRLPVGSRAASFAFYVANGLYEEAYFLLESDAELCGIFGPSSDPLLARLRAAA